MTRRSLALRAYRLAIRLLWHRALRREHGTEAVSTVETLACDARQQGRRAAWRYWRTEFAALIRVAWESRRGPADLPDHWLPPRRSGSMFASLGYDLRHALRLLRRTPGFTSLAVLTLALAIGANTAIFSVINTVLLRPIATPEPDRLVVIREHIPGLNLMNTELAPAEVLDLAARREVLEGVAAYQPAAWNLTGSGAPVRVEGAITLGDFFGLFRLRPHLGRLYTAESSTIGSGVVVLSYSAWQRYTGADAGIIGRTIQLDGRAREVVGVLPPGFDYPRDAQVYQPLNLTPRLQQNRGMLWMTALGRLQPDVTHAQLAHHLASEAARWNEQHHAGASFSKELYAVPLAEYLAGRLRLVLLVLMGAVIFVLLIACANIGSLQLVRTAARMRELAVRSALGAGRLQVARQFFVENALLAILGGGLGLWLGALMLRLMARWDPAPQPLDAVPLDGQVLAFTAVASIAAAIGFGTLPALRGARLDAQGVLRDGSRGAAGSLGRSRLLRGSVVAQISLAVILLIGSGLMIRSLERLLDADVGFVPSGVVSAQIALPASTYESVAKQAAFYDAVLERLRAMPGVEATSVAWALPFSDQVRDSSPFEIAGRPAVPGESERHAEYRVVGHEYFRTMGIPLLGGRSFVPADDTTDPARRVALIDEHFARQFFAGEDPIGRQIVHARGPARIVGVVGTVHHGQIGEPPKALTYYHFRQTFSSLMGVVVRSSLDRAATGEMIRTAVREVDPGLPVYDLATMEERVLRSLGDRRLAVAALGGFAGLSLLLAMLGVYGVMRYSTSQRSQEIGIRMALGASRGGVVRMIVRDAMLTAGVGVLIGLGGALALTRLMEGMLFEVGARDPITFAAVAGLITVVALVATLLPARNAARVEPVVALKAE